MAVKPKIKITIAGTPVTNYIEMVLDQDIYDHHYFRIVIKHDDVEELGSHTLEKSMDWLGQSVLIDMDKYDFTGIITSVDLVHSHNHFGDIVVSGYSKTILLETAPHKYSWFKKTLREVVSTLGEAASDLTIINKPKYSETINYIAQYDESHFDFLKRVASDYKEWLYYDGTNLVFGEPNSMPTIPVIFGKDADNIKVGINIKNVKFNKITYHSKREEFMDGSTQDNVSGLDYLGRHAFGVSKKVFNFKGRSRTAPRIPDKGSLDDDLKKTQAASAADLSVIEGRSKKRGIHPGSIIELTSEGKKNGAFPSKAYGSYLVISTKHVSSSDCNYTNVFKAIPAGVKTLPAPTTKRPKAYSEIAHVISNEDPDGKGRVQVQTHWQKLEGLNTNWIRVMTPDAGSSGAVSTNRGFTFIPEQNDEVVLGYRYGDPSRPFVLGSVYNGTTGAGGDKNNKIKSLGTRTGSAITFNDDENAGNVVINDPSGNNMVFDGAGNATVTSPETITFNCGKSKIHMDKSGTININGLDININAGNSINVKSFPNEEGGGIGTISISAKDNVEMSSIEKETKVKAMQNVIIVSEEAQAQVIGKTIAQLASFEKAEVVGTVKTLIIGGEVQINQS